MQLQHFPALGALVFINNNKISGPIIGCPPWHSKLLHA
jgi:hypothetical protein